MKNKIIHLIIDPRESSLQCTIRRICSFYQLSRLCPQMLLRFGRIVPAEQHALSVGLRLRLMQLDLYVLLSSQVIAF